MRRTPSWNSSRAPLDIVVLKPCWFVFHDCEFEVSFYPHVIAFYYSYLGKRWENKEYCITIQHILSSFGKDILLSQWEGFCSFNLLSISDCLSTALTKCVVCAKSVWNAKWRWWKNRVLFSITITKYSVEKYWY